MTVPPTILVSKASAWDNTSQSKSLTLNAGELSVGDFIVLSASSEDGAWTVSITAAAGQTFTQKGPVGTAGASAWVSKWSATSTSAGPLTFTLQVNVSGKWWGMSLRVYTNSNGIGALRAIDQTTGSSLPSTTLAVSGLSAIDFTDADWSAQPLTGHAYNESSAGTFTETVAVRDSGGVLGAGYGGFYANAGTAGTKTIGMTAPSQRWTIVALEVLGGPDPPVTAVGNKLKRWRY